VPPEASTKAQIGPECPATETGQTSLFFACSSRFHPLFLRLPCRRLTVVFFSALPAFPTDNLEWLCAFLLGGGLLLARQQHRYQARLEREGVVVPGIVCRLEYKGKVYYPVVRFQTHQQDWIIGCHHVGTIPARYRKGEEVAIRYLFAGPQQFAIVSGGQALLVWVPGAAGIGLLAYGIVKGLGSSS